MTVITWTVVMTIVLQVVLIQGHAVRVEEKAQVVIQAVIVHHQLNIITLITSTTATKCMSMTIKIL